MGLIGGRVLGLGICAALGSLQHTFFFFFWQGMDG